MIGLEQIFFDEQCGNWCWSERRCIGDRGEGVRKVDILVLLPSSGSDWIGMTGVLGLRLFDEVLGFSFEIEESDEWEGGVGWL
jgi:hypothetical protein